MISRSLVPTPAGPHSPQPLAVGIAQRRLIAGAGHCPESNEPADRALALVTAAMIAGRMIDELWLDYDLRDGTTSQLLVDRLVALAESGMTFPIRPIHVRSSRVPEAQRITDELQAAGYNTTRNHATGIWTRQTVEPTGRISGTS